MSLADHWSEGNYLDEGIHRVKVTGWKRFTAHSGNNGVEFEFTCLDTDRTAKCNHMLMKKCYWTLAKMAKACGFTQEQAADMEPDSEETFIAFMQRTLKVKVEKDGEYHKVTDWFPLDAVVSVPIEDKPAAQTNTVPSAPDRDIPF